MHHSPSHPDAASQQACIVKYKYSCVRATPADCSVLCTCLVVLQTALEVADGNPIRRILVEQHTLQIEDLPDFTDDIPDDNRYRPELYILFIYLFHITVFRGSL